MEEIQNYQKTYRESVKFYQSKSLGHRIAIFNLHYPGAAVG